MIYLKNLAIIAIFCTCINTAFSQVEEFDDFSLKAMPNWTWTGVDMKYSHETDNKENGYADIFSYSPIRSSSHIGTIIKYQPMLFNPGNFLNVMLKGVSNDVYVKFEILYDVDNNGKYTPDVDIMMTTKPISMNFSGWKEVKVKLDEDNFKLISNYNDDFSITEEEAIALQLEFESGKNYKESKFESGIALISQIPNKESLSGFQKKNSTIEEKDQAVDSYFKAKNYPNPFNPTTTISFTLQEASSVTITVYDRLGREVTDLLNSSLSAGYHTVDFNAATMPSGIYFYRIKTPDRTEVRKMLLSK
ncbi:hypothetical protein BH10BAC5_BH10BAC5_00730 [soil metagenome]